MFSAPRSCALRPHLDIRVSRLRALTVVSTYALRRVHDERVGHPLARHIPFSGHYHTRGTVLQAGRGRSNKANAISILHVML